MCGIFGLVIGEKSSLTQKEAKSLTENLFLLSELRGKESAGVAIKNTGLQTIEVYKNALPAHQLIKDAHFTKIFEGNLQSCFATDKRNPITIIGHTRLVTNGDQSNNNNNQPVVKNNYVGVHNGIICNIETLWDKTDNIVRENEVDTEWLFGELSLKLENSNTPQQAFSSVFNEIEGTASIAGYHTKFGQTFLATNNGSLYYVKENGGSSVIFSSEKLILEDLIAKTKNTHFNVADITWLGLNKLYVVDDRTAQMQWVDFEADTQLDLENANYVISNSSPQNLSKKVESTIKDESYYAKFFEYNVDEISQLKRCSKCLLPETFPFIEFDLKGECNYCGSYQKLEFSGMDALREEVKKYKKNDGKPDCIVTLSGGRDSCYGLHVMKEELGMNPIAYTYDWGMVTDLARRNQARMCGKLGVEHILISANITQKRLNIKKNVMAWLKKPNLGTIPLFMAGDKQYFYWANYLQKRYNTPMVVLCENMLETTNFKSGFCGIKPKFGTEHTFSLSGKDKVKMLAFYGKEYITNPKYLNSSMRDTIHAFFSYYFLPKNYLNMFDYLEWDEKTVENTLFDGYNWEISNDTTTTWRIGDGTAAFYNYIYYNVAGFSEFDTFRSNQIREGTLTREKAMELAAIENKPRIESFLWYCETIGVDPEYAIKVINDIPKLYRNRHK
jgi:asparagine synthetase B (glutamine-hydrolysing)